MWYPNLDGISHWFFQHEAITLATLATLCVAMLLGCAVGCMCSPRKEKDQIFHRTVF